VLAVMQGATLTIYLEAVNQENESALNAARQQAKANIERLTGASVKRVKISSYGLQIEQ
jgi:hypothetical protein